MFGVQNREISNNSTDNKKSLASYFKCKMGLWSSGMILASGARGRGFDSPQAPSNLLFECNVTILFNNSDTVAEWLRRQIRNLLGFARAGSNPAGVVFLSTMCFPFQTLKHKYMSVRPQRSCLKKLLVGESNPGRPRDRRKCYQLHQPGIVTSEVWTIVLVSTLKENIVCVN